MWLILFGYNHITYSNANIGTVLTIQFDYHKKYTNKLHLFVKRVYRYWESYVDRISEQFLWVPLMCSIWVVTCVFFCLCYSDLCATLKANTFLHLKHDIILKLWKKKLYFPCLCSTVKWSARFPKNGQIGSCLLASIRVIRVRGDPPSAENRVGDRL